MSAACDVVARPARLAGARPDGRDVDRLPSRPPHRPALDNVREVRTSIRPG